MNYYEKRYYTVYHAAEDKTFIMCEDFEDDDIVSTEVVGFHYGEPMEDSFHYIGKCKACFK